MFGASSELASVMEFGFYQSSVVVNILSLKTHDQARPTRRQRQWKYYLDTRQWLETSVMECLKTNIIILFVNS